MGELAEIHFREGEFELSVRVEPQADTVWLISVGYRVKSARGVQFRRWATQVLRQYLLQGYVYRQKRSGKNKIFLCHRRGKKQQRHAIGYLASSHALKN